MAFNKLSPKEFALPKNPSITRICFNYFFSIWKDAITKQPYQTLDTQQRHNRILAIKNLPRINYNNLWPYFKFEKNPGCPSKQVIYRLPQLWKSSHKPWKPPGKRGNQAVPSNRAYIKQNTEKKQPERANVKPGFFRGGFCFVKNWEINAHGPFLMKN